MLRSVSTFPIKACLRCPLTENAKHLEEPEHTVQMDTHLEGLRRIIADRGGLRNLMANRELFWLLNWYFFSNTTLYLNLLMQC